MQINELFKIARETNDYASESFMQWFVDEQVEEESSMDDLLTVAERVREVPMMLEEFLARDGDQLGGDDGRLSLALVVRAPQQRLVLVQAAGHADQMRRQLRRCDERGELRLQLLAPQRAAATARRGATALPRKPSRASVARVVRVP